MSLLDKLLPENKFGDRLFSLIRFFQAHKRLPDANNFLFNDRYFFMKTSDDIDKPLRALTTDKELVKLFIKSVVGNQYNVETLAIIRSIDELRKFNFPNRCYIKATHGSGWSHVRKNGEEVPLRTLETWFRSNYYHAERERNYKHLDPKIIIEPLVFNSESPSDYKAFCYKGRFKLMTVISDRNNCQKRAFFDREWKPLDINMAGSAPAAPIKPPQCLPEMIRVAETIASYFDLIRVDFYTDGNKILIGELTHCVGAALSKFESLEEEELKGRIIFGGLITDM